MTVPSSESGFQAGDLLATALGAVEAGFSVHYPRANGTKAPAPIYPNGLDAAGKEQWTWLHPDGAAPTRTTVREWYGPQQGIGLRCGTASSGLECFEFDCRKTYEMFREAARECGLVDLVERIEAGYLEKTPGDGIHWLYLTDEIRGNTKLAQAPAPTDFNPRAVQPLIETRGENGFVIIAPSGGTVHPSGRPYILIRGGFDSVVTLTGEERDAIWDLARSFDAMPKLAAESTEKGRLPAEGDVRPGDVYEQETTWEEILEGADWKRVYSRGETTYWRRPGKSEGTSATTNHNGSGLLHVFSSSTPFPAEKSYTKFAAYAYLNHGGNFSEAARSLRKEGYGASGHSSTTATKHRTKSNRQEDRNEEESGDQEWKPPRLSEVPFAEPFPIGSLPPPVAECIQAIAAAIGCPIDFPGTSALIVAGAAIGRSASLLIKPNYFATSSLYGMAVGNPSSGKTPALKIVAAPLVKISTAWLKRFREETVDYLENQEKWDREFKGKNPPPSKTKPVPPSLKTAVLNDCTTEVLKTRLAENPRGLLNTYDEGSAWIGSLNQYRAGKGADRQFFMSVLYGTPIRVDRSKDKDNPLSIDHPFLSIMGNMPPETLVDFREGDNRSDGFIERILIAYPEPVPRPYWSEVGYDSELANQWSEIIHRLHDREMSLHEGDEVPHVVRFSPAAKEVWIGWYNANVQESRDLGYESSELSVDGKLEDFAARIALILHLLTLASDPTTNPNGTIPPLSVASMEGAIAFWRYFRSHHRRARWQMSGGIENKDARHVLDWIRRHGHPSFTKKEITDHLRWLNLRPGGAEEVFIWMEERHLIRKQKNAATDPVKRGRLPSPVYEVNPVLLPSQNSHNSQNSDLSDLGDTGEGISANCANSAKREEEQPDDPNEVATWTV